MHAQAVAGFAICCRLMARKKDNARAHASKDSQLTNTTSMLPGTGIVLFRRSIVKSHPATTDSMCFRTAWLFHTCEGSSCAKTTFIRWHDKRRFERPVTFGLDGGNQSKEILCIESEGPHETTVVFTTDEGTRRKSADTLDYTRVFFV